jgi:hypothetical protein
MTGRSHADEPVEQTVSRASAAVRETRRVADPVRTANAHTAANDLQRVFSRLRKQPVSAVTPTSSATAAVTGWAEPNKRTLSSSRKQPRPWAMQNGAARPVRYNIDMRFTTTIR